jgi:hypothetical protein
LRLLAKVCTPQSLIINATTMHTLATTNGLFSAANASKPMPKHIQALVDVLASLGWCAGL